MRRVRLTLLATLLSLTGCSSGEQLYDVSGTVTFNDKPVPVGTVFFDPDPMGGPGGMQGVADIKDGRFDTALGGHGVRGGAYIIRVGGYDGKSANEAPRGQPLFNEYTFKKELPKEKSELPIVVPKTK